MKTETERQFVYITGFWNDTKSKFVDYECIVGGEDLSFTDEDDNEIFFYFESIEDLKTYMIPKNEKDVIAGNGNDFTITSYSLGDKF